MFEAKIGNQFKKNICLMLVWIMLISIFPIQPLALEKENISIENVSTSVYGSEQLVPLDFQQLAAVDTGATVSNILMGKPLGGTQLQEISDASSPYYQFYKFFSNTGKLRSYEFEVDESITEVGIRCAAGGAAVTYSINGIDHGSIPSGINYVTVTLPLGTTTVVYKANKSGYDEGTYTFVFHRKKSAMLQSLEITNLIKNLDFTANKLTYVTQTPHPEVTVTALTSLEEDYSVSYAVYNQGTLEMEGILDSPLTISTGERGTSKNLYLRVTSEILGVVPITYSITITRISLNPITLTDLKIENLQGNFQFKPGTNIYQLQVANDQPVIITPSFRDIDRVTYQIGENDSNPKAVSNGESLEIGGFVVDQTQKVILKVEPPHEDIEYISNSYTLEIMRIKIPRELKNIEISGAASDFVFDPKIREYNLKTNENVILKITAEDGDKVYSKIGLDREVELTGDSIDLIVPGGETKEIVLRLEPSYDNPTYKEGIYILNLLGHDKDAQNIDRLLFPLLLAFLKDARPEAPNGYIGNSYEWSVMNLASLGYKDKINVQNYINGQAAGVATTTTQTDYAKAAINLMSLGYAAEDLATFQAKGTTVNLIDKSCMASKAIVNETNISAAFNTVNFPVLWASSNPDYRTKFNTIANQKGMADIEDLVGATVRSQRADGSFPVVGDIDGIAMILQGLAPYYAANDSQNPVTIAVNKGLAYLSGRQDKTRGTFDLVGMGDSNNISSESVSMVIVALSALGIDANSDSRFLTRDGKGLIDVLEENFITDEGLLCHIIEKDGSRRTNEMASEQGFRALASYKGFLMKGKAPFNIYNAQDHFKTPTVVFPEDLLQQTIDYALSLKEVDYEPEGWAVLQDILNSALEIAKKPDAAQEQIDGIVEALIAAYQSLIPKIDLTTKRVSISVVGDSKKGTLVESTSVEVLKGATVYDVLAKILQEKGITHTKTGIGSSIYVSGIDGLSEFDNGPNSGWMYTVNGKIPPVSAGAYIPQDGDVIHWYYTEDYTQSNIKIVYEHLVGNIYSLTIEAYDAMGAPITIKVKLNGKEMEGKNGTYTGELIPGENKVEIIAVDEDGEKLAKTYMVVYTPEEIEIPGLERISEALAKITAYIKKSGYFSDWIAIGYKNAGEAIPYDYLINVTNEIKEYFKNNVNTKTEKVTDHERRLLAILAAEGDPTNIEGYDLLERIYNFYIPKDETKGLTTPRDITFQGLNGVIYGLIALDAKKYEVPKEARYNREYMINYLLSKQNKDGGWDLGASGNSDVDITSMTLQALAPYHENGAVKAAIDKGIVWLSLVQRIDGGYLSSGSINSEGVSQTIMALCVNGVDPTGEAFTKNKRNLLDALLSFQREDGAIQHTHEDSDNVGMSTEQAYLALLSYAKFLEGKGLYNKGKNSVYYFGASDTPVPTKPQISSIELDSASTQVGKALSLKVTVNTLNMQDNSQVTVQLVDQKGKPIAEIEAVKERIKNNQAILILNIPETLPIGDYYIQGIIEGGHAASSLFKIRDWQPGPGDGSQNPGVDGVSAYIRVEGYGRTLVPRQLVSTTNFDITPYLSKGTGSSAGSSGKWDPDTLKKPTVLHALITALEQNSISQYDIQDYGWSLYVAMIAGEREFDLKGTSGWMYRVNDGMPNYGSQAYNLRGGEDILWYFGAYGSDTWYTKLKADKTSGATGEKLVFTLKGMTTDMNTGASKEEAIKDAVIYVNGKPYVIEGAEVKTDQEGKATLIFYEPGTYSISAERFSKDGIRNIIRPEPLSISISGSSVTPPSGGAVAINNPLYKELYDGVRGAATDEDILTAVGKTLRIYSDAMEKISTQRDIDSILKDMGDVLSIYGEAAKRIESEDNAAKLMALNTRFIKALTETLGKLSQNQDKEELTADTVKAFRISITLIEKIQKEALLDQGAKEAIEVGAELIKALGEEMGKAVEKSILQMAQTIVSKYSTYSLQEKAIHTTANKVTAEITLNNLEALAEKTLKKIHELEQSLKENDIPARLSREIAITLPTKDIEEAQLQIKEELLQRAFDLEIEKVALKTELATFHMGKNTFEKTEGESITLTAQKVSPRELSVAQRTAVPANSILLELNARIGATAVKSFKEPIEVTLPYEGEIEEGKEVKVFLLKEDGSLERVGGTYDAPSKTITFSTGHFSKYLAMETDKTEQVLPAIKQKPFDDLGGYEWAEEAIEAMAEKGILSGRRTGVFDPGANITRAEFAALITKLTEAEEVQQPMEFEDMDSQAWYYQDVAKAYTKGIIKGRNEREFDPKGQITREEMTVIIAPVLKGKSPSKDLLNRFKDKEDIAPWAEDGVSLSLQEGIVSGMGDGSFAPKAKANRAQAAVMLYRLYNLIQE
ncbi:MAG: DUF4430 domain-containing protein [Thermotaleaceae bacterium]